MKARQRKGGREICLYFIWHEEKADTFLSMKGRGFSFSDDLKARPFSSEGGGGPTFINKKGTDHFP